MRIVADENIPFANEAFASLGDLRLVAAARLGAEVRHADVLIVRSVTPVNQALLEDTRIRFIGTVTAGVDHIDAGYLARRGITLASAAGCNSTAVAQHVAAFLCALRSYWENRRRRTLGIVGVGHCGSKVERLARVLGFEAVVCDPPLARQAGSARFRPLSELRDCDVITLHTPMIRAGMDRTESMIDETYLKAMKPGGIVINTARGGLVVESALVEALQSRHLTAAALDVWCGEPRIDLRVLEAVTLATPHVAGYSHEGRSRGTEMIHQALCTYLGIEPHWSASHPDGPRRNVRLSNGDRAIPAAILEAHPVRQADAALRRLPTIPPDQQAGYFESLRKHGMRHEFSAFSARIDSSDQALARQLEALGFSVENQPA